MRTCTHLGTCLHFEGEYYRCECGARVTFMGLDAVEIEAMRRGEGERVTRDAPELSTPGDNQ